MMIGIIQIKKGIYIILKMIKNHFRILNHIQQKLNGMKMTCNKIILTENDIHNAITRLSFNMAIRTLNKLK